MEEPNNAQVVFEAGQILGGHREVDNGGLPYVVIPERSQVVNLEKMMSVPPRKRAVVQCRDVVSFATYLEQHRASNTIVFATLNKSASLFRAVIDYHQPGEDGNAGWCEHIAEFRPERSEEFGRWVNASGQWLRQQEFAEFLQDNSVDIVQPDAATVLEVARELTAKKSVQFRSGVSLKDGTTQFTYDESLTTGGGAKGHLEVPEKFTIQIPIHAHGGSYSVPARLRYRIEDGGRLMFRFDLVQFHKLLEVVNSELLATVKAASKCEVLLATLG